jgi:hypothetical protein
MLLPAQVQQLMSESASRNSLYWMSAEDGPCNPHPSSMLSRRLPKFRCVGLLWGSVLAVFLLNHYKMSYIFSTSSGPLVVDAQ